MDVLTILLIGVGLAMDAFAVSICKGLAMRKPPVRACLVIGLWFGLFQFLMPVIGYYLGSAFYGVVSSFAYVVAFLLLVVIGANMIREAFSEEDGDVNGDIGTRTMLLLAVATSIDALAVGISFAMEGADIFSSALVIGVVTFLISFAGVKIGGLFGDVVGNKANIIGGVILILIGVKILLENTVFA